MPIPAKAGSFVLLLVYYALIIYAGHPLQSQQAQVLGSITGRVHLDRGGTLPERVLVSLESRSAPINGVYTDSQGSFSFHGLPPGPYTVIVNDAKYVLAQRSAVITPFALAPQVVLDITVAPKTPELAKGLARFSGSNPEIIDVRDYSKHFPKKVIREFQKGVKADRSGKKEDAIQHYAKAMQIAPDFYPAHNNVGSDYMSKSNFAAARKEFEEVIRLNQSDAAAYLNLTNACMLMGQLTDAEQYLAEGMRRQPDSALGHFLLGSLDIRTGKYDLAEAALRQAIQLDPVMAQARLQLVNLLVQRGRNTDAVVQLHDFVSAFPDSPFTPKARALLQRLESSAKPYVPN